MDQGVDPADGGRVGQEFLFLYNAPCGVNDTVQATVYSADCSIR